MKSSALLKWLLVFFIISWSLGLHQFIVSASEKDTALSKIPPADKKQLSDTAEEVLPEIFLETKEYDSGSVYEGEIVTHTFAVKNKGKGDLLIQKVNPG